MAKTEPFEKYPEEYDSWYDENQAVFQSELNALKWHFEKLPQNIHGIEVGLASGRFSQALGIKEGVEPSEKMRDLAVKRGVEVMDATAERLPYGDLQFDFVLFVTICFLDNLKNAFREAHRVLKQDGSLIIGFIDLKSPLAKKYNEKRKVSLFYKYAQFYSVDRVEEVLKEAGFKHFEFSQALFDDVDEIEEPEIPKEGHGEGSFVVVRAMK